MTYKNLTPLVTVSSLTCVPTYLVYREAYFWLDQVVCRLTSCGVILIGNAAQLIFTDWCIQLFCQTRLPSSHEYDHISGGNSHMLTKLYNQARSFCPFLNRSNDHYASWSWPIFFTFQLINFCCSTVLPIMEFTNYTACEGVRHWCKRAICVIIDTTSNLI